MIDLLKFQMFTEKSIISLENTKYVFQVDTKLNKKQLKNIFEELFRVKIQSINTCRLPKNFSNSSRKYANFTKKVIITLNSGSIIRFAE
uniref:50S ribosomal protein L23 n=1 Tax=Lotharella vacuolata TaxID=74820 RepID=A0A140JZS5_9EUKA|nr:50S ribosomal protein L23 [Lotharella vacuolata]BAU62602.1 50S ribosomal protein L23 [Lotharella vacuolata]